MNERILVWEEKARRIILLVTVAGVPLIMLPGYTLDPFNVPKLSLLLCGTGLALLLRGIGLAVDAPRPRVGHLVLPVGALLVPLALAWLLASPYKGWSLWGDYERYGGLVPQIVFSIFVLLLTDAFRARRHEVLSALVLASTLVGVYSVLQRLELDPFVWSGSQNGATLGNPNYSGSFLAIALPMSVWGALRFPGRHRDLAQLAILPTLAGLIISSSQGPWAAAGVGLLTLVACISEKRLLRGAFLAAAFGLALIMALAVPFSLTSTGGRFLGVTVQDRAYAGTAALRMAVDNPLLGRGPDVFAIEGVSYRTQEQSAIAIARLTEPHSAFLSYLTSTGILGGLGFLFVAGWSLRKSFRSVKAQTDVVQPAVVSGVAAYFAATLVAHDQPALRMGFWALIAITGPFLIRDEPREKPRLMRWAVVPIASTGLLLIALAGTLLHSDRAALQGSRSALDNNPVEAISHFERALLLDPTMQHRELFAQRVGELGTRRGEDGSFLYEKSRSLFSYLDDFPDIDGLIRAARLSFAWGVKVDRSEIKRSLQLFARARSLDKFHPILAAEMADVMLEAGQIDEATLSLEDVKSEHIPFSFYWSVLTEAYVLQGKFEDARITLSRAAGLGPEDPKTLGAAEIYRKALDIPFTAAKLVRDLSQNPVHEAP